MDGVAFLVIVFLPITLILMIVSSFKQNNIHEVDYTTDNITQVTNTKKIPKITYFEIKDDVVDKRPSRGNSHGGIFYDDHGIGFTGGDYSL